MAKSDVVMEADSGFGRNMRSPGSADFVIKVNGKDVNNFEEEGEEMVGEGLFSFDEDVIAEKEKADMNKACAKFDLGGDNISDDSGQFDMSQAYSTFSGGGAGAITRMRHSANPWARDNDLHLSPDELDEDKEPEPIKKTGSLAYATSLPITIPAGRFWPPRDVVDSFEDKGRLGFDENPEMTDKTVLPQRPPKDLYSEMRAQARSIQAADDPERLFGERPSRRRYQTGQASVKSQVVSPLQQYCEGATVMYAANVEERFHEPF